ncbi:MAG: hypothetical protein Q7U76_12755 [Nitrospirota bacterium]|nr:hypothetical protein [Nitrospirota bacterium]
MSLDRKVVLLRAAYALILKCPSAQETTVFYDEADCDGHCLMEDIQTEIDMEMLKSNAHSG